jgi:DNA-binding XRE family transcriptional regulator
MEMDFCTIIHGARTTSGFSQSDLSTKAGIGIATICRIEKEGDGTTDVVAGICWALHLRVAGLPQAASFGEQVRIP